MGAFRCEGQNTEIRISRNDLEPDHNMKSVYNLGPDHDPGPDHNLESDHDVEPDNDL